MSSNDQFDELFRKALPSVDVPTAPEMDWNAMAGIAKGGAAAGGTTSLWTATWVKLFGGAMAVLVGGIVVWNVTTKEDASDGSVQLVRTEQSGSHASSSTGDARLGPADHVETNVGSSEEAERDAGVAEARTLTKNVGAQEPGSRVASTYSTSKAQRAVQLASGEQGQQHRSSNDLEAGEEFGVALGNGLFSTDRAQLDPAREAVPTTVGSPVEEYDQADEVSLTNAAGRSDEDPGTPLITGSRQRSERFLLERATSIDLLRYGPPLIPLNSSPIAETTGPAFVRFSLTPWVALSNSIFADPAGTSNEEHLAQLSGGREMLGTVGLRAQYNVDQRVALLLGVQYTNKGSLQGRLTGSGSSYTYYSWSGRCIEVPIAVRYALQREGKEFYARIGGTLQFNARGGSDRVVHYDATRKEISTLILSSRSMGAAIDVGIGVQLRIARGIGLFIEPSYQHGLSPVVKYPSSKTLPYNPVVHSIGLATGIVFQLPRR